MKNNQIWICLLGTTLLTGISTEAQSLSKKSIKHTKNKEVSMTTSAANKEVIQSLYEQGLNQQNRQLLTSLVSNEYIATSGKRGIDGFEESIVALLKAFPDAKWKIIDLISEDDKVVVRQSVHGTQTAQFQNIKPTRKTIETNAIAIYQLKDGKIISSQILTDRLEFLQQLGVLPVELSTVSVKAKNEQQVTFIDKFFVPKAAKEEFHQRVTINRNFIKTLPGFVKDIVYEHTDENGNLTCITMATWESQQALEHAKQTVQAEYTKEGFNPSEMLTRLGITMDRSIYQEVESN
ncbi:ester cyclase [Cytophagaceae bacterium YF14B1]|uniref:Ester cyclase n=1 Tax=Xanthocytophaga flava TaxID=3048013 RepID=A0AAE3QSD0_9BACT|nr:ester cyclase [Xanthocytophaga flavus]MDJ1481989.1 ester cyclase [Xanthocytophaga flavus]